MESHYFFEEELITKMHSKFIYRFNLDKLTAAELALEILEMLKVSNSNLNDFDNIYFQ